MTAAARRHVGDEPAAQPLEQLGELGALVVDIAAGRVQVERQHPPGGRARVEHRHRARLVRRTGRQRPDTPCRIGAAAIRRDPDVRRTGERGRDRMPSGLRGGAREAVRIARVRCRDTRRVARGQC